MEELVRDGAEDDSRKRPLARGADDDHPRVTVCRERDKRLGRALREQDRLRLHARLLVTGDSGIDERAAELLERLLRLAPLVADASVRRLRRVRDEQRVAEALRKLHCALDGAVRAPGAVDPDDDGPAHCWPPAAAGCASPEAIVGSTASNGLRPKKRSFPPARQSSSRASPRSRKPVPITNGTPRPSTSWPVYEFSGSAKSIDDLTKR